MKIEKMKKRLLKVLSSVKKAPDRKHYLEFITAALSIPVLLTVILVNINNLNASKKEVTPTPVITSEPREIIIREGSSSNIPLEKAPSVTSEICKKEVGPISISSPKEGSTVSDNPVNFIIKHNDDYCTSVFSYRINNGSWSEYSSNTPSIYNLPNGAVKFQLRAQSTVSSDQDSLELNFNYAGSAVSVSPTQAVTPTPTTTQ